MLSGAMQLRKIHYQADVWLKALHQQGQQYSFRPAVDSSCGQIA